jgi:hypothetical protein
MSVWLQDDPSAALEAELEAWDPFMEMQFYVVAWTEAGEGEASDVLTVTAIDYCDPTTEDCDFENFFEDDELNEFPIAWIGAEVSETVYHLEWDAPYDPYGFWGAPLGYIIYADMFQQGGRGEQWRPIARVDGSEEWGNSWKMDLTNDMYATTCTHAPPPSFADEWEDDHEGDDDFVPPTYDEVSAYFVSLNMQITEDDYNFLVNEFDDPENMTPEQQQ